MRRLRRISLNAATAVSLVLCVATVVLWVRSYSVSDRLFRQTWFNEAGKTYWIQDGVQSGRGGVGMTRIVQSFMTNARVPSGRTPQQEYEPRYPNHWLNPYRPAFYPGLPRGLGAPPGWSGFKWGGYGYPDDSGRRLPRAYGWQVVVPYWAVLWPLALVPAARAILWNRRRRRRDARCCHACGYDLRATPGRCPECGTIPAA